MGTPVIQPVRGSGFYLAESIITGDRGVGPIIDGAVLLESLPILPIRQVHSGDKEVVWFETPSSFPAMSLSATASAAATTLNVTANYAQKGDVLYITHNTTSEYVLVTAVSNKALTVTRSYNGSSGAICSAAASSITISGNVNADGSSLTSGVSIMQNRLSNYLQISHETYIVSGSSAAGILQSGENPLMREKALAILRMNAKINRALFHNYSATQMTSAVPGMAKGIRGFCTTNDYAITSNVIGGTSTSTAITLAKFNKFLWQLRQAGGSDMLAAVAGANAFHGLQLAFAAGVSQVTSPGLLITGGGAIIQYISIHGQMVRLAYDRNLPTGTVVVHDVGAPGKNGVYFSPAIGREMVDKPIPTDTDAEGGNLLTEWTCVVLNEATSGYITDISTGG